MKPEPPPENKFPSDAGVAIGPLLFIVAIIGILAAAIAAGSGGFNKREGSSNKLKASALLQSGDTLRMGMSMLKMGKAVSPDEAIIDVDNTAGRNALFSPDGGGVAPPPTSPANRSSLDKWAFPRGPITGFGSGADEILAVIPVSRGVCAEINKIAVGVDGVPPSRSLGTFKSSGGNQLNGNFPNVSDIDDWTQGATIDTTIEGVSMLGARAGCVFNSGATLGANCPDVNCFSTQQMGGAFGIISPAYAQSGSCTDECQAAPTSPFYFFQVLAIQ